MSTRYFDGVYKKGRVELLDNVSFVEGALVKVVMEEENGIDKPVAIDQQIERIRQLKGAFKGSLSSSEEFSRHKSREKALER